jgi:DNA invertase Pin-like site-specific DNA recombinase
MQMVGAFAEFERAMLKERTKAGLDSARQDGRIGGCYRLSGRSGNCANCGPMRSKLSILVVRSVSQHSDDLANERSQLYRVMTTFGNCTSSLSLLGS